jgi:fatty acid desaturase
MDTSVAQRIANIGAGERRKRLVVGIGAFTVGLVIAISLIAIRSPLVWRLPLIFLFYVGALGFFQSRDKT